MSTKVFLTILYSLIIVAVVLFTKKPATNGQRNYEQSQPALKKIAAQLPQSSMILSHFSLHSNAEMLLLSRIAFMPRNVEGWSYKKQTVKDTFLFVYDEKGPDSLMKAMLPVYDTLYQVKDSMYQYLLVHPKY